MPRPPRDETVILKIARMRYDDGLQQSEIARVLRLSEPTVSRYLKQALDTGLVEIRVASRAFRNVELERSLVRRLGLAAAVVVERQPSAAETRRLLGNAVARALDELLVSGAVIGVSNGETVAAVAAEARRARHVGLEVVTLIGGVGRAEEPTHTGEICRTLAGRIGGRAWILPLPAVIDSPQAAALLYRSEPAREIFTLIDRMSVALVGVGAMTPGSSTFQHGLFTLDRLGEMSRRDAVGSICARFFDADGRIIASDLDERTLSITLERLAATPHRLGVAMGAEKVAAIRAAMRGGLINRLGTDAPTAQAVLEAG
jgi:DNA-binding transcriptional regulator LsrR (DeoR family)